MNIYTGIKILDLSRVFSGPFATRHFADLGAQVIKIEPASGDDSRNYPPVKKNWSGYFEILNRNKTSLILDLKKESDLKRFYTLVKSSDVVVENYTPGVTKKLKIDYAKLKLINPGIIYASIVGEDENTKRKYYDVIAQAESGLISLNGEKEDMKIATSVVDAFSGMKAAFAISSALYARLESSKGTKVTISMLGSAFDLLEQNLISTSINKTNPKKYGNMDSAIAPFGVFKTADGSIAIGIGNDVLWEKLSGFMIKANKKYDPVQFKTNSMRIKNSGALKKEIEKVFRKYKTRKLLGLLDSLGIPGGMVNKMNDILKNKSYFRPGLLKKVNIRGVGKVTVPDGGIYFKGSKQQIYKAAPKLNEIR